MWRLESEDGVALPTALLAMLVLLMLGGLFVAYAVPQQRVTTRSQAFETGLHVAESAAEIAIAALADPDQPERPFAAPDTAPADRAAARQWAVNHALSRVDAGCGNFERTAGGDGVAIVDGIAGTVYGVGFLPDCETRRTTRVMRVTYDTRPLVPLPTSVGILTGGNIHFDHANSQILAGGIHANGDIVGTPGSVQGPYSASGTCSDSSCQSGAPIKPIPNFTARDFWEARLESATNPTNDPFYELCPDGTVGVSQPSQTMPCEGEATSRMPAAAFNPNWQWSGASGGSTWTWTANAGPPPGQYYAYRSNLVNQMNNGAGNSSRATFFAEADPSHLAPGHGSRSGTIQFTTNPKFFPSWPGVGVIADVDVIIDRNLRADGQLTLVFAREQFRIAFNGNYERLMFMVCDQSLAAPDYDPEAPHCTSSPSLPSTLNSPIHTTRITQNASFDNPLDGEAIVPNLGITGVGDWETL
jgi:hypothetical protein